MPDDAPKFYLDQMLRLEVAEALRKEGYDAMRASEAGQARADDNEVLQRAIDENRVLVTLDEHFGDWVVLPLCKHPGVIRIKVHPTTSYNIVNMLIPFLRENSSNSFENFLIILSPKRSKWVLTAPGSNPLSLRFQNNE